MKSSGFNFDNSDYDKFENSMKRGFSGGAKAVGKAGKNVVRKLNRGGAKASKKAGKLAGKTLKATVNTLKLLPKKVLIFVIIFVLLFMGFSSCGYLATGEDAGETGNRIDNNNSVPGGSSGGSSGDIKLSNANANCMAYYELLSKNKSVWQEYTDSSGNTILITPDDPNAVTDYFGSDKDYYISPDLLFCMNKYIFGDRYVYPEAFLKPVYYDEDVFSFKPLTEEGKLVSKSYELNKDGTKGTKEIISVSDYGIGSVMRYKSYAETKRLSGSYYKKEVLNLDGSISEVEINEPFNIVIDSKSRNVLDKVITFAGDIEYEYIPTTTSAGSVRTGKESADETDNTEIYIYANDTATFVYYGRIIKDENGNIITGISLGAEYPYTKRFLRYNESFDAGYSAGSIEEWIAEHSGEKEIELDDGTILKCEITYTFVEETTKDYSLKKYRTASSGTYIDFYTQKVKECDDLGNQYLYDYMENFSCFYPTDITRDYETFRKMTSQASKKNGYGSLVSGGDTAIVNTSENEKRIWDALIQWGYNEKQAAAVMGNIACEGGFSNFGQIEIGKEHLFSDHTYCYNCGHGIVQWTNGRWNGYNGSSWNQGVGLLGYSNYKGVEWVDPVTQIEFMCMELDTKNTYPWASCQWGSSEYVIGSAGIGVAEARMIWENELSSIEDLTLIMCENWERPRYSNAEARSVFSRKYYNTFAGSEIEYEIEVIEGTPNGEASNLPNSVASSNGSLIYDTREMNSVDREAFNNFYHIMDDENIFDGTHNFEYKSKGLSKTEIDNMLLLTNSYINGTTLDKERLNSTEGLWCANYLTDLSKRAKDVASVYGMAYLDNPRLTVESVDGLIYWGPESPFTKSGYGLPNCTAWCYGRFWENTGDKPKNNVFLGNAQDWWQENINTKTYKYGSEPRVGSIMVWRGGSAGHVCFVEQINADGTMTISQSGWRTEAWNPYMVKTDTIKEVEKYNGTYVFLGYIYSEEY